MDNNHTIVETVTVVTAVVEKPLLRGNLLYHLRYAVIIVYIDSIHI
jgi:hypothetical protein